MCLGFFKGAVLAVLVLGPCAAHASLPPERPSHPTAAAAFHRGELAYRQRDFGTALPWFRAAGEQGDAEAQNYVGWIYTNGLGSARNLMEGARWYRRSAEKGNPIGENYLGWMYQHGDGVKKDGPMAVEWYTKAAERGHKNSMTRLAAMYEVGDGIPKDKAKAEEWREQAKAISEGGH